MPLPRVSGRQPKCRHPAHVAQSIIRQARFGQPHFVLLGCDAVGVGAVAQVRQDATGIEGDFFILEAMAVESRLAGHRLGDELMGATVSLITQKCLDRNVRTFELRAKVRKDNAHSRAFVQRWGFDVLFLDGDYLVVGSVSSPLLLAEPDTGTPGPNVH